MPRPSSDYLPISDYGIIGDAHTAALVSLDGSIDWCCWPYFDSPAVFCRLLDVDKGGYFHICPVADYQVTRAYLANTNVLTTTFTTAQGQVRITDFMPIIVRYDSRLGEDIFSSNQILRLVEGINGEVEIGIEFKPTFDYARVTAAIDRVAGGLIARNSHEALLLNCPVNLSPIASGALTGRLSVKAGQRICLALTYLSDEPVSTITIDDNIAEQKLQETISYWLSYSDTCTYTGPYRDMVVRSALTLKLLTFEPTGALVAAPTTSLPEEIGGVRNWDYRYSWLRDSALILYAMQSIGYYEEARDFFDWLDSLCNDQSTQMQIMYRLNGSPDLPEQILEHLDGYRQSRPVRIGNGAVNQIQHDIYGEVLDAAHFYYSRIRKISPTHWQVLHFLAEQAAANWREPDYGIWEVRNERQHFLYSKLLCWVALDRAIKLVKNTGVTGNIDHWQRTADEIKEMILTEGYNSKIGAFTQVIGGTALDASALVIPLVGFLPATDPRVVSTSRAIQQHLSDDGLIYRYLSDDGLPGSEATFAICSYWMVDNLALSGRIDEAIELFNRLAGYANDLGLFSEEIDHRNGLLLGNFPQGFTHLALIRAALNIAKSQTQGAEDQRKTPADREHDVKHDQNITDRDKRKRPVF